MKPREKMNASEKAIILGESDKPPEPAPPAATPPAKCDPPEWLARALSPEVQAEINKLVYGRPTPTGPSLVDHGHTDGRPRNGEMIPQGRRDQHGATVFVPPKPCPMFAREPRLAAVPFKGLTLDEACDRLGFPRTGNAGLLLSKCRQFHPWKQAGDQLSYASQATNVETAKANLAQVRLCRRVIEVMLDAIDTAEAEVKASLNIE